MIWVYRILFLPVTVIAIPYLLWHMKRRGGYQRNDLKHKFGAIPAKPKSGRKKRIWIQAVSVGEVRALKLLLSRLAENPDLEVVLTTTTSTGYAIAKEAYANLVQGIYYFPLDFVWFSRKAWNRIQPDLCLLMEGELWPEHIHQANSRGVSIVLINARISDKTFRLYRRLGPITPYIFHRLDRIIASSQNNADKFRRLGCPQEKVLSIGNIKCDMPLTPPLTDAEKKDLIKELGLDNPQSKTEQPLIVCGASTWNGEEAILLRIQEALIREGLNIRMLIVPRHAERRNEISDLMKSHSLSHALRTQGRATSPVQVCIADTTGELTLFLQISDLVFIGKSLPPNQGGQTPIEAGMLGKPILFGPDMSNFRDIAISLLNHGIAQEVQDEASLKKAIRKLCLDQSLRGQRGEKAREWLQANQGATDRTLNLITNLLYSNPVILE